MNILEQIDFMDPAGPFANITDHAMSIEKVLGTLNIDTAYLGNKVEPPKGFTELDDTSFHNASLFALEMEPFDRLKTVDQIDRSRTNPWLEARFIDDLSKFGIIFPNEGSQLPLLMLYGTTRNASGMEVLSIVATAVETIDNKLAAVGQFEYPQRCKWSSELGRCVGDCPNLGEECDGYASGGAGGICAICDCGGSNQV